MSRKEIQGGISWRNLCKITYQTILVRTCLTARYWEMELEWKSAPFISPDKGGTAQYGFPRQGVGGGCCVGGVTSGSERWKAPLLVNPLTL